MHSQHESEECWKPAHGAAFPTAIRWSEPFMPSNLHFLLNSPQEQSHAWLDNEPQITSHQSSHHHYRKHPKPETGRLPASTMSGRASTAAACGGSSGGWGLGYTTSRGLGVGVHSFFVGPFRSNARTMPQRHF